jgi:tyrosine-protein kinase Etk/Wzc
MEPREFNLWKLLEIIALRIRFIITFVLIITAVSIITAFLLPRWYKATTLLLPPKDENLRLGRSSNLEDMISLTSGLVLPIRATPSDVYARILKSRNIAERVIEATNLKNHYGLSSMIEILGKVKDHSDFSVTEEGLLEITFSDRDPKKAAEVTNAFASELDRMNRELYSSRAKITREFISNRLKEVSAELDSARIDLRNFQAQYKAIDLDQQTQLAIESAVNLKVALAENEIDLNLKEKILSPTHPDVIALSRRVDEVKSQISALEYGSGDSSYFNLPVSEVPALKIKLAELTSRLKISETLYEILSEQFEQAKIQEKMDTPTLAILDKAYPPDLPYRPRKTIIVLISAISSLFVAIFLVIFMNYLAGLEKNSPDDYRRASTFLGLLRGRIPKRVR